MKTRKFRTIITAMALAIAMCLTCFPASAVSSTSNNNPNVLFDEEEGMYYFDFTIPENSTLSTTSDWMTSYVDKVGTAAGMESPGNAMYAEYSYLTVSASAQSDTGSLTMAVQLKVKGLLNQYYNVTDGYKTFVCDGQTHHLFAGFSVEVGKTYRFYYKPLNTTTDCPNVTLSAVFWE